jgi:hypothetical protein
MSGYPYPLEDAPQDAALLCNRRGIHQRRQIFQQLRRLS